MECKNGLQKNLALPEIISLFRFFSLRAAQCRLNVLDPCNIRREWYRQTPENRFRFDEQNQHDLGPANQKNPRIECVDTAYLFPFGGLDDLFLFYTNRAEQKFAMIFLSDLRQILFSGNLPQVLTDLVLISSTSLRRVSSLVQHSVWSLSDFGL